ncbi:MAG TPA: type I polyketide synthase, partial [Pirellulaceae bacterium]
ISYVEAHGTGTPLGDPIEIQSLARIFKSTGPSDSICHVASVKANIGHTETVSGVAGLVKVALMMREGIIPGQTGLETINENVRLEGTRLRIPRESIPWETGDQPRVAGVSSFGFGGTNTHVILESAVTAPEVEPVTPLPDRSRHLLAFSAKSKAALATLAERLASALEQVPEESVADFCYSANVGRSHFNHRCAIMTSNRDELRKQLNAAAREEKASGVKLGEVRLASRPKVAFLFTGQGAQYSRMAAGLYERHPIFRQVMDQCDEILRLHRTVSLNEVVFGTSQPQLVNETEYTQPALFAVEYALAKLWQSWGVEPAVLLGHSVGEYVAACVAGVFALDDGLRLIAKRAELMQQMPSNGTMAVIFAGWDRVSEALRDFSGRVVIATANGPENNVISGETAAV